MPKAHLEPLKAFMEAGFSIFVVMMEALLGALACTYQTGKKTSLRVAGTKNSQIYSSFSRCDPPGKSNFTRCSPVLGLVRQTLVLTASM